MLLERSGMRRHLIWAPLLLGLAVYGIWAELPFIAWLGVGFLVAEYQPTPRRRGLASAFVFVVGGAILLVEVLMFGHSRDVYSVLAAIGGLMLLLLGGLPLIRSRSHN
jgi:hypothetical protein